MNSHELRAALGRLELGAQTLLEDLKAIDVAEGDERRCESLEKIVSDVCGMSRDLVAGKWEGRKLEGYPVGSDGEIIGDGSSVVR